MAINHQNSLDKHSSAYEEAAPYQLDNELILHWYPRRLANRLVSGSLLELGVGHGYSTREFNKVVDDHTIIDGSKVIIEQFKRHNPDLRNLNIVHSYFEEFSSELLFDNIVMGFVLEHVDDPLAVLTHYVPLLSAQGKIFIAVPNATSLHRRLGHEAGFLTDMHTLSDADKALGHKRYFDVDSLRRLIEESGLKITSMEGLFLKPLTTSQLESLSLDDKIYEAMMRMGIDYPELSTALLVECAI